MSLLQILDFQYFEESRAVRIRTIRVTTSMFHRTGPAPICTNWPSCYISIKSSGPGGEAMLQYGNFMNDKLDDMDLPGLWQNLTAYCKQDIYAMVLLLGVLRQHENPTK